MIATLISVTDRFSSIMAKKNADPACGDGILRNIIEQEIAPVKERMRQKELADKYLAGLEKRAAEGDEIAKEMLQQEKFQEELKREERRIEYQMRKQRKLERQKEVKEKKQ